MTRSHGLWDVKGKPDVANTACMKDCAAGSETRSSLPEHARGVHGNLAEQNRAVGAARGLDTKATATALDLAKRKACMSCHAVDKRIVGPAFKDVSSRYRGQLDAESALVEKVRTGGSGAWGPLPMPPNPDLTEAEARALIRWILGDV